MTYARARLLVGVTGVGKVVVLSAAAPDGPRSGAWHEARTALFLSWAGLGFLSRALHCGAGRPELWVLLPCD